MTANGPCNTWTAWFTTLPVAEALGPAILVFDGACCALTQLCVIINNNVTNQV